MHLIPASRNSPGLSANPRRGGHRLGGKQGGGKSLEDSNECIESADGSGNRKNGTESKAVGVSFRESSEASGNPPRPNIPTVVQRHSPSYHPSHRPPRHPPYNSPLPHKHSWIAEEVSNSPTPTSSLAYAQNSAS